MFFKTVVPGMLVDIPVEILAYYNIVMISQTNIIIVNNDTTMNNK